MIELKENIHARPGTVPDVVEVPPGPAPVIVQAPPIQTHTPAPPPPQQASQPLAPPAPNLLPAQTASNPAAAPLAPLPDLAGPDIDMNELIFDQSKVDDIISRARHRE